MTSLEPRVRTIILNVIWNIEHIAIGAFKFLLYLVIDSIVIITVFLRSLKCSSFHLIKNVTWISGLAKKNTHLSELKINFWITTLQNQIIFFSVTMKQKEIDQDCYQNAKLMNAIHNTNKRFFYLVFKVDMVKLYFLSTLTLKIIYTLNS